LLGPLNRLRFRKPIAWLLFSVGQVAFSGRMLSDAANYLYVVMLAGHFATPTSPFLIQNNKTHWAGFTWPKQAHR